MSQLLPVPLRFIRWKCPKCGAEKETVKGRNPWIFTCLPLLGCGRAPKCPKCGEKMIEMKLYY